VCTRAHTHTHTHARTSAASLAQSIAANASAFFALSGMRPMSLPAGGRACRREDGVCADGVGGWGRGWHSRQRFERLGEGGLSRGSCGGGRIRLIDGSDTASFNIAPILLERRSAQRCATITQDRWSQMPPQTPHLAWYSRGAPPRCADASTASHPITGPWHRRGLESGFGAWFVESGFRGCAGSNGRPQAGVWEGGDGPRRGGGGGAMDARGTRQCCRAWYQDGACA
jgi:hypothetical protein